MIEENKKYNTTVPSEEFQQCKAAIHLVCADLILGGYNAFQADSGLPYNVLVGHGSEFVRIKVKSTLSPKTVSKSKNVYCFPTRRAKRNRRVVEAGEFDYFALVALDIKKIAYLKLEEVTSKTTGKIVQMITMRSKQFTYGTAPGRYIEDYGWLEEI